MAPGETQVIKVQLDGLREDIQELKTVRNDVATLKTDVAVIRDRVETLRTPAAQKRAIAIGAGGGLAGLASAAAAFLHAFFGGGATPPGH